MVKGLLPSGVIQVQSIKKCTPGPRARYCTRIFKIEPIDEFLGSQGACELMIGLNADEEDGREGNYGLMANITYSYPLIEEGLTRADCEGLLHLHGMHPSFPVYMLRGGCRMCFYKSEKEFKALYHLNRKEFEEVAAFEEGMQDKRSKFYSIMGNGKSLKKLAWECEQEKQLYSVDYEELYKSNKKAKTCGAFCHR